MTSSTPKAFVALITTLGCVVTSCAPDRCEDGVVAWTSDGTTWTPEEDGDEKTVSLDDGDEVNICPGEWDVALSVTVQSGEAYLTGGDAGSTALVDGLGGGLLYASGDGHLLVTGITFRDGWMDGTSEDTDSHTLTRGAGIGALTQQVTLDSARALARPVARSPGLRPSRGAPSG